MSQQATCKFLCTDVDPQHPGKPMPAEVSLQTQYDENAPEDTHFTRFTPAGYMQMTIDNPALEGFFVSGQFYRIVLEPWA